MLGRMTDLKKKNCSVHCATNNWMIILGDGKARGQRMLTDKINELDQLLMPVSQMTINSSPLVHNIMKTLGCATKPIIS